MTRDWGRDRLSDLEIQAMAWRLKAVVRSFKRGLFVSAPGGGSLSAMIRISRLVEYAIQGAPYYRPVEPRARPGLSQDAWEIYGRALAAGARNPWNRYRRLVLLDRVLKEMIAAREFKENKDLPVDELERTFDALFQEAGHRCASVTDIRRHDLSLAF